ncbi:hypothetical protein MTR_7g012990 [Medicago truncatula]|uniref:Uncharacterized protein n=1 Tax=Medicago truncatula TaxID=3880 RepID=G7L574_MEDTR|nr:hypothetical protein MTR_7g012990 [Medicago truncatula]
MVHIKRATSLLLKLKTRKRRELAAHSSIHGRSRPVSTPWTSPRENNEPNNRGYYDYGYMYPKKVVLSTSDSSLLLKNGDENWKAFSVMSAKWEDMCLFKGWLYVVNKIGQTFMIGPDSSVQLVAKALVDGGRGIKFLGESEGDLLLEDASECLYHGSLLVLLKG